MGGRPRDPRGYQQCITALKKQGVYYLNAYRTKESEMHFRLSRTVKNKIPIALPIRPSEVEMR